MLAWRQTHPFLRFVANRLAYFAGSAQPAIQKTAERTAVLALNRVVTHNPFDAYQFAVSDANVVGEIPRWTATVYDGAKTVANVVVGFAAMDAEHRLEDVYILLAKKQQYTHLGGYVRNSVPGLVDMPASDKERFGQATLHAIQQGAAMPFLSAAQSIGMRTIDQQAVPVDSDPYAAMMREARETGMLLQPTDFTPLHVHYVQLGEEQSSALANAQGQQATGGQVTLSIATAGYYAGVIPRTGNVIDDKQHIAMQHFHMEGYDDITAADAISLQQIHCDPHNHCVVDIEGQSIDIDASAVAAIIQTLPDILARIWGVHIHSHIPLSQAIDFLQYKQLLEVPDSALSLQEQVHYTQNAIAAFLQWQQQGHKNDLTTWLLQSHSPSANPLSDH